jgi:hypothetical protein
MEGLRDGLRQLGYVDGKSIVIERRRSAETYKQMRLFAAELARFEFELAGGRISVPHYCAMPV